ncbi:MAG TPA: outer membrane protein transport protein [Melioribacteraceae bacterium]|nr:outer membrane protein transport protein [Melioribacteraceae bacterium]
MKYVLQILTLVVITASLMFAQSGTKMLGVNAKSVGRAGTILGTFDSPDLMMNNPAGISFIENSMLDFNISLMFPSTHFKNSINDVDGDKNTFVMPDLAFINKYKDSKLTWGAGVFTAGGMGADFLLKHELFRSQNGEYQLQKYHSMLAVMQGGLSAAYKLTENFSVGVTAHVVFSMLEFSMPYSLNPSIMKGTAMPGMTFGQIFAAPSNMGGFGYSEVTALAEMKELSGFGFNGKLGFAYVLNENISFGLSYSSPTTINYKNGKANMDMTAQLNDAFGKAVQGYMMQNPGVTMQDAQAAVMNQFAGMGIELNKGVIADYDLEVELTFPQIIGFGFAYKPNKDFTLSGDFEWQNWKNAFDKMTINLSNGTNSNINKMLGNSGDFTMEFPMNWKDVIAVKLGAEYDINKDFTFRLGYSYNQNPVPETTVFPVFPAIVEHHLTFGGSYKVTELFTIHAAFETALNKSMDASNNNIIANEYKNSTSQLSTILAHLAFSYQL